MFIVLMITHCSSLQLHLTVLVASSAGSFRFNKCYVMLCITSVYQTTCAILADSSVVWNACW